MSCFLGCIGLNTDRNQNQNLPDRVFEHSYTRTAEAVAGLSVYCKQGGMCADSRCKLSRDQGAKPWCLDLKKARYQNSSSRVLCKRCRIVRGGRTHGAIHGNDREGGAVNS